MRQRIRKKITAGTCFVIACLLVILIATRVDASGHPFLIVKKSDYQQLRDRASLSPWKEMQAEALRKAQNLSYKADEDNGREAGYKLRDVMGYTTLAYILDPANQQQYVDKIRTTLEAALPDMQQEHQQNEDSWNTNVAFQGGVFNAIVALDIIYDDLPVNQRSNIETAIDQLVSRFIDNWGAANHSVSALWALYKSDRSKLERELQEYRNAWTVDITDDGVYVPGTGYGMERINGCTREHKALGMDVWEYQGLQTYYRDQQFSNLHEWLYGYSHTPDFRRLAFGDSSPEEYLLGNQFNSANCSTQAYRAYKFSGKAQQYAAWQMQDDHRMNTGNAATLPNGRLLTYLLMGNTAPESGQQVSPSRVFPDGGAWFIENRQSRQALIGALWNVKRTAVHAHKETNAIALSGYGTHLLSNSGYRGWNNGVGRFSWNYIYRRAVSGNTGLIDYEFGQAQEGEPPEENDHQQKHGAGITESLLTPTFDYARGDSGEALPNGQHFRNFHFVHPADGKSGYWFLVDEFTGGSKAHLAFHPYSRAISPVVSNAEYQADIVDYKNQKLTDVDLVIFLATEPDDTTLHNGAIAGPDIQNQYLYPTYRSAGSKQIVTVLFPANPDHPKPAFTRIQGERYTGATVNQGDGVIDYVLESDPSSTQSVNGASFQAARSFFRLVGDQLRGFYAVGKAFEYGENGSKVGMEAEQAITIYLHDRSGQVSSAVPQVLTLYAPNIREVRLNNTPATVVQKGEGWVQINIPKGISDIKLR